MVIGDEFRALECRGTTTLSPTPFANGPWTFQSCEEINVMQFSWIILIEMILQWGATLSTVPTDD